MRNFSSQRKSWTSRDRVSLLATKSPQSSPSKYISLGQIPAVNPYPPLHGAADSFDESMQKPNRQFVQSKQRHQSQTPPSKGAIQFVPAYTEAISPATTQPLTSPEDSFDKDETPTYQRIQIPQKGQRREKQPTTATPTKGKTTRMKRLASLFSSRAVVKGTDKQDAQMPSPASPPQSEASSAYIGWPGTQDKRGGTVAIASSYEDSDPGKQDDQMWVVEHQPFGDSYSDGSVPRNKKTMRRNYSFDRAVEEGNPADFHLAAAVADAAAAAKSPIINRYPQAEKVHRMAAPLDNRVHSIQEVYGSDEKFEHDFEGDMSPITNPWNPITSVEAMSDISTGFSKTSSAYFNPREVRAMTNGQLDRLYGVKRNSNAAAAVMRARSGEPQAPTEEVLALRDHYTPPHKTLNAANAKGYRGFLEKTKDVPNLMDGTESESTSPSTNSSRSSAYNRRPRQRRPPTREEIDDQILEEASSDIFDGVGNATRPSDAESDVFDGISNVGSRVVTRGAESRESNSRDAGNSSTSPDNFTVVLLGGGLTTIQTTAGDFSNRITASDFDDNLSTSDCDEYGYAEVPGLNDMASKGTTDNDRSLESGSSALFSEPSYRARQAIEKYNYKKREGPKSSSDSGSSLFSDPYPKNDWGKGVSGGLQQYYIHPEEMKVLVRFFRKMSKIRSPGLSFDALEREEDATKAFALSEMRSRILEKDIERGLERMGGTTTVDDIVLTPYNQAALRVRDAVVVSKAWRDGATPQDVINTALLTQRAEKSYYMLRPQNRRHNRLDNSRSPEHFQPARYTWEEVSWVDDLEMSQYRCHSIGPRCLRGYEMFTIGDCQSILLKLANERCMELRGQLNDATTRQITAEELMKDEADFADGMMTEAEMTYLTSMEEVKTISHKLVLAEKAFNFVRERIEKLVSKYESLLVKFDNDNESVASSSVLTCDSSYVSEYSYNDEERERSILARRAQRAEVKAELVAREAMLGSQQARAVRADKEKELEALQQRLSELQSECSAAFTEREHSVVLARAITAKSRSATSPQKGGRINESRISDIKQRFRDRSAAKQQKTRAVATAAPRNHQPSSVYQSRRSTKQQVRSRERNSMYQSVGEEMFQHLDFYERSLKSVETKRA